jgi:protein-tyrosine phosphatase
MKMNRQLRRLPLQGTNNTRDLGGYPCPGGATRWGVFLRSDHLGGLTEGDIAFLKAYGLTDVVDLRREDEVLQTPSAHLKSGVFTTHSISMNDTSMHSFDFQGDVPGSMSGLYLMLLDESRPQIAQMMRALAAAGGAALFHCAVGKDRTGMAAALLLKLCGVADADVVADYSLTEIYIREMIEDQRRVFREERIPEYVVRSVPASMLRALRHLNDVYGGARRYLARCGVDGQTLDALVKKLVCPPETDRDL